MNRHDTESCSFANPVKFRIRANVVPYGGQGQYPCRRFKTLLNWMRTKSIIVVILSGLLSLPFDRVHAGGAGVQRTLVSAHRGDSSIAPENSLPAVESAVRKGVGQIEFDVYLTRDNHLVVIHDPTVDRTTNGVGDVVEMTLEEIRHLDAGGWFSEDYSGIRVPTLAEVLSLFPFDIVCNVHLKNAPGVAAAAALEIKRMGRLEHCFLACTLEQIEEARAVVPEIKVCNMSRVRGNRAEYVARSIAAKADYIQLHHREGIDDIPVHVRVLQAAGVRVNFCCTDDPKTILTLARAGVDFILTDNIDTAIQTLDDFYGE